MPEVLQEPITGSDLTYTSQTHLANPTRVALDASLISGGNSIGQVSVSKIQGVRIRGSGVVVFPKTHDRQIQGNTFLMGSTVYDLLDGGSSSILMAIGSCDVHAALDSRSDGDANLILMENVSVSGTTNGSGTAVTVINEQRSSAKTMNATFWTNPSILTSGAVIHTAMYLGGSGLGNKFVSAATGTGIHGGDLIFSAGSAYWVKWENLAYRDLSIDWNIEAHEHCVAAD